MKTNRIVLKAIAAALLTASGVASADTQSLAVSATVPAICKFSTASRTLSFDIAANPFAATVSGVLDAAIQYKCSNGTAATSVTRNDGANSIAAGTPRMRRAATADYIPYTLTFSGDTQTGTGFGSGQEKTLTVTSSIAAADFANATAGTYTDSVTLTLSP